MLQSQVRMGLEIKKADCLTFLRRFFVKCKNIKIASCFAAIYSVAAVTLKTISDARAGIFRKYIFKRKMFDNLRW